MIKRPAWMTAPVTAAVIVVVVGLALAALFAWEVRAAGPIAIDDAYITFSYSKNLAAGHGPVYGHGERVEGYSNFLWMVLVAIGLRFQLLADPLITARIVAIPFMALLGLSTYALARVRAGRMLAVAAVALLVLDADVVTAFAIGLESLPSAALLMLGFTLYLRSWAAPRLARWVVPALVAVALTRIDGFLPLGYVLAFEALRRLARREGGVRDYLRWAAPGVAVYLAWFAWRWWYYGLPLPATYYAKALIPKLLPRRGWEYVRAEVRGTGVWIALPFAALLLARRRLDALCLVGFALLHVAYVIKVGGDWMPYGRFLLPVLPIAAVIVAWGGGDLAALARARLGRGGLPGAALSTLLALAALAFVVRKTERHLTVEPLQLGKMGYAAEQAGHVRNLKSAARLLDRALHPGARLVTDYGGVFAYYTRAAPIEMWGLCNAMIATRGGIEGINPIYGRTCPECYPRLDPEFFHVWVPIVRDLRAFHSHAEVVSQVWQTDTIGRYLSFQRDFVSGRVMIPAGNQAVYFLERRRPGIAYLPRVVDPAVLVDYPFEPGGRAVGL
jgi:arabinofuranosyltransferase